MKTLLFILIISLSSCRIYDYRIKLYPEATYLYTTKGKLVDVLSTDTSQTLDKIILKDNL